MLLTSLTTIKNYFKPINMNENKGENNLNAKTKKFRCITGTNLILANGHIAYKNYQSIKEYPSVEISDYKKQKYFKNLPYYNFLQAEEELGFSFADFSKNDFADFLNTCYVNDFIILRRNFIMRNFTTVRFLLHKFKSPFGY